MSLMTSSSERKVHSRVGFLAASRLKKAAIASAMATLLYASPSTADRRHNEWESTPSPTPSRQLLPRFARQLAARQTAVLCHSWPCSPPPRTAISLAPSFPALSDCPRSPLSRRAISDRGCRRYSCSRCQLSAFADAELSHGRLSEREAAGRVACDARA